MNDFATIPYQPVTIVPDTRAVCECIGCNETALYLHDCGPATGLHQLCGDHTDSLRLAPDAGDWVAKHCCY